MQGSNDSHAGALARRELPGGLIRRLPSEWVEDRVPKQLLEPGSPSSLAQWRMVGLRLTWISALLAPIVGTLWAVQALGGPFTLIVAASLLGLSTALFGWVVGRLYLAEGLEALARGRLSDAYAAFQLLLAHGERHRPQVLVHALLGRTDVLWRWGELGAAAESLEEAEAYVHRADIPPIGAATRRLLLARKAQLAACLGELERARRSLRELEALMPESGHDAATDQWQRFVSITTLFIDFHANPDAPPDWRDSAISASDLLERALEAWARERHGDFRAVEALQAELLAPSNQYERALLQARAPRLAAWIESWQGGRSGYR